MTLPQGPDTILEWALAGAGGTTFVIFAVALQNFFVQPPALTRGQRLFQDVSVLVAVTHCLALLMLDSASEVRAGIGIATYGAALASYSLAWSAAPLATQTCSWPSPRSA